MISEASSTVAHSGSPRNSMHGESKKKKKKSKNKSKDKEKHCSDGTGVPSEGIPKPLQYAEKNSQPSRAEAARSTQDAGQWNFAAEYNDHFETPVRAYTDISCVLDLLAEELGKAKSDLVVYDPYYCKGSMVGHMASLGYSNVINRNRDFYSDIATKSVPEFDILMTNPPYSGEHKQKLLTFLQNRRVQKPFALLLPAYTVTKSYWRDFVSMTEKKNGKKNGDATKSSFMYLLPATSYNYDHPEGTGHKIPPFYSAWLIGGFSDMNRVFLSVQGAGKVAPAAGLKRLRPGTEPGHGRAGEKPTAVDSVDAIIAAGYVSGEKRPNPKGRKRRKA